ncbi:MAG: dephospho-CoA kinase [Acidimicrobiaceae bacterium]|nr:dephospho-CoA kinase [Acidimicrobiaceae bacterium]MCS5674845.1 dephospho-CoA kinase [Acidimicrobiales bacterium]MEE2806135.1 dephospho-CoA kinase [Actinomycetota bacterium]|tara:strand:+ start:335 stop:958 length:624 start_codon:yes stop_codon:yes gene_type:complete
MLIVGLTGGMGAGKSTVAEFLSSRGAEVVDVDALGREIIEPGGIAVSSVVDRFGSSVSGADGGIDRAALASIVFGDEEQLAALEEISHPAINELLDLRVDGIKKPDSIIIFDMAVLFESQLGYANEHPYEIVVVVEAPISDRLDRLETQRGVSREDALARIESQASDEERRSVAQFVIANGDDLTSLAAAVDELWSELEQLLASKQY